MPNPYAPKRKVASAEVADLLEATVERLTRLGAAPDVLAEIRENWPPPAEVLSAMALATDQDIRDELARIEEEYDYATTLPEEERGQWSEPEPVQHGAATLPTAPVITEPEAEASGWIQSGGLKPAVVTEVDRAALDQAPAPTAATLHPDYDEWNVEAAVAWIGTDPERALLALDRETSTDGKDRVTVIRHAEEVAGAATS